MYQFGSSPSNDFAVVVIVQIHAFWSVLYPGDESSVMASHGWLSGTVHIFSGVGGDYIIFVFTKTIHTYQFYKIVI